MLSKVSGVVLCAVLFHQSLTPLAGCVIKHFPLRILQKKRNNKTLLYYSPLRANKTDNINDRIHSEYL